MVGKEGDLIFSDQGVDVPPVFQGSVEDIVASADVLGPSRGASKGAQVDSGIATQFSLSSMNGIFDCESPPTSPGSEDFRAIIQ